jgi:hypothetical protein
MTDVERLGGGDGISRGGCADLERVLCPHAPDRYPRRATARPQPKRHFIPLLSLWEKEVESVHEGAGVKESLVEVRQMQELDPGQEQAGRHTRQLRLAASRWAVAHAFYDKRRSHAW